MIQSFTTRVDGPVRTLRVNTSAVSISWSRWKTGTCQVQATSHDGPKWLSLSVEECPEGGKRRYAMATLNEPAARALYEQLRAAFEPSAS